MPTTVRHVTPEQLTATVLTACAAVMILGYACDLVGLPINATAIAAAAVLIGVAVFLWHRGRELPAGAFASFVVVVASVGGYVAWLASPSLLPVTDGPDVVHHLQLIHVIQRTAHLPADPQLRLFLVEMMNYTPGAHLLAAVVSGVLGVDALRVLAPIVAAMVALKAGMLFVLALRLLPSGTPSLVQALAAPILLFVPAAYTLGASFKFFFFAQVVSETFAVAMLLAGILWQRSGRGRDLSLVAIFGVATFLSWPVSVGPPVLAFLWIVWSGAQSRWQRSLSVAVALGPMALVALIHAAIHGEGASIIGASGAVTQPSLATLGASFAVLSVAGVLLGVRLRERRPVVIFLAAALTQSLVLAWLDARAGAHAFYLPFKMVYLMVLPAAVLAALALADLTNALASRLAFIRLAFVRLVAAALPVVIAVVLLDDRVPVVRPRSPITPSSYAAGLWVRDRIPPSCVDYFSRHWLTGYWLHLAVLDNPRVSDRMRAETFDFPDVAAKWIEGRGLPYAIVEDMSAIPKELRPDMTSLATFGPAAVVANVRAGSEPEHALCRGK